MKVKALLILIIVTLFVPFLRAQGYYGRGIPTNVRRMSGQGTGQIEGMIHYVSDKDTSFEVKGTIFEIGVNYEFPSKGNWRTGRIRGRYTGGDMNIGPFETEYDYRFDVDGEYFVKGNMSISGLAGIGSYTFEQEPGDTFNYGVGFNYYDLQQGTTHGITIENGRFDTFGGVQKYSGIEINGMEQTDFYWLKWYLGRVDGENLIKTDVCFPIHFDAKGSGGYGILFRYVNVNSHTVSTGAPQLVSYGPLIGDWTEHEEYLLRLTFGVDRNQSDFSVLVVYGFYRTEEFDGSNEAVIMRLGVKYHF